MNINQKIWLGFGSVLALVGVGSALSYLNSRNAETTSSHLVREYVTQALAAGAADEAISMARIHEQRFANRLAEADAVATRNQVAKFKAQLKIAQDASSDPERDRAYAAMNTRADAYLVSFEDLVSGYVRRGLTPEQGLEGTLRKAVHTVESKIREINHLELTVPMLMARRHEKDYLLRNDEKYTAEIAKRIEEFHREAVRLALPARVQAELKEAWNAYFTAFQDLVAGDRNLRTVSARLLADGDAIEAAMSAISETLDREITAAQAGTLGRLADGRRIGLVLGVASGLIGAAMAVWIAFSLGSLNRGIRTVGTQIGHGAAEVLAASTQLSQASQTLSSGSSDQAASLEETSASLEEMASMTKRNADSATRAKDVAARTRAAADHGATEMDGMRRAMDDIKASSDDIAKIIRTIDEIAFQTNILALNAAVEAARAGEAGMGFAVVADEVRNLAQRAAQSARETSAKIEGSIAKSEHGVAISRRVAASLAEIVQRAREVDSLVAEIATASAEQSQGIDQVNTAVSRMDKITQSLAATAEESASSSEELNSQAVALNSAVGDLLALVGARAAASAAPAAVPDESSHDNPPAAPRRAGRSARTVARKPAPAELSFN